MCQYANSITMHYQQHLWTVDCGLSTNPNQGNRITFFRYYETNFSIKSVIFQWENSFYSFLYA